MSAAHRLSALSFPCFVLLCLPLGCGAAEEPRVEVPHARQPVALDGIVSQKEWPDAAVLSRFDAVRQDASHAKRPQPWDGPETIAYVKHDGTNLWVGVRCAETEAGYPQAFPRPPDGNLTQDDAVQIILATPGDTLIPRGTLGMGGYAGALDTPDAAATDYYSFIVNAAGVSCRAWNERPLHKPFFDAAVARDGSGWSVECRIPLASFGAQAGIAEAKLFLNVFRIRPPMLIGWHLPGFGGYQPMPLGRARLLPESGFAERTVEAGRERAAPEPHVLSARIGYFPLSGSVVGVINGPTPQDADHAILRVTGLPDQSLAITPGDTRRLLTAPLVPGSQPARFAELALFAGTSVVHAVRRDLSAVAAPEWLGTDAGSAYLREKIPAPWTRPEIHGRSVTLCDKTLRVGAFGLFDSVLCADGEGFAGQAEIELTVKGQKRSLRPRAPQVTADGNSVRIEALAAAGDVTLDTRGRIEYDGFTEVKMCLTGVAPQDLSLLRIRIPLRKGVAKVVHRELTQRIMALDGFGFEGASGPLWVGNETRGLAFSSDTPLFFSHDERRQIRVVEERRRTVLELTLVDGPGQAPAPLPVFRFLLQPTPTKPQPARFLKPTLTDSTFELWSDYQGYPDLAKIPTLKTWSAKASAAGQVPILYACQGLAENAPGFASFSEDLMTQPPWMFYRRHSDPGKGVACYACCKRGPEGDLQLWGFKRLAQEAGIRGVLSDGLGVAWEDDNPGHTEGCGREAPVAWERDAPSRITAQRAFLKRLRGLFCDTGEPVELVAHTGGALDIHTLSFFDTYMDGEQLARYPSSFQPPAATFAVGYSGKPWGLRGAFWSKNWVRSGGQNRALTYALLHDTELWDALLFQQTLTAAGLGSNAVFHPYWKPGPKILAQSRTGESRVSWYSAGPRTLVVVGNTGPEEDAVTLDLRSLTRIRNGAFQDLLTGQSLALERGRCALVLPRGHCMALRLGDEPIARAVQASKSEPPPAGAALWTANTNAAGVSATTASLDGCPSLCLSSTEYQARAEAVYRNPLSNTFTAVLHFRELPQRLIVQLGPITITRDWCWTVEGPLSGWSAGEGPTTPDKGTSLQPEIPQGTPFTLTLSMRNGSLDAMANGRPLIRGMAFEMPTANNRLTVGTWAGFSAAFRMAELSEQATALYAPPRVLHPVQP